MLGYVIGLPVFVGFFLYSQAYVAFCHGGFCVFNPFACGGDGLFCFYFYDVAVLELGV